MKIEKLDHYGRGITKVNDKICFVSDAIEDEDVLIEIVKDTKKYQEAKVIEYKSKSNERMIPKCKYYSVCGGCHIMHMNDNLQKKFKENKIKEIIIKYAGINPEFKELVIDNNYNYRNKVVLHVENGKLGFYKNKTNEIIEIEECLLLDHRINELIKYLNNNISFSCKNITIKLGNVTDEVMLIIDGDIKEHRELLNMVDVLIINNKVLTEKDYIISIIGNKKYKVSKNSFFQVNKFITEKLYNEVKQVIKENKSKNVLDLYCGTGTIGIYISDLVNKVIGIEVVEDAIVDANFNKELNHVTNIEFIQGKVEDKINNINEDIDTVILDPPRSGLHKNVIDVLEKINPKNIIYVSCDPMTLARDLKQLKDSYDVSYIKPFDMFPNTYHVETVCVLERRER